MISLEQKSRLSIMLSTMEISAISNLNYCRFMNTDKCLQIRFPISHSTFLLFLTCYFVNYTIKIKRQKRINKVHFSEDSVSKLSHSCLHKELRFYLVQNFLKIRRSHPICHVPVCWVGKKEFPFCQKSCLYVLLPINVLLASVHNTNIT